MNGETYYYRLTASDTLHNISAAGDQVIGEPVDMTAPAAISDLSVTQHTSRTVTIQWTAPGDNGNVGTAASYDLRYSTSIITNSNFDNADQAITNIPIPDTAGTSQQYTFTGLSPFTTYYFAIKTTDIIGNISDVSNIANQTTDALPTLLTTSVWPKFHRDLRNSGNTPILGAQVDSLLWSYQTGNVINSSPSVDETGVIYFGSEDGKIYALNNDGSLKWNYATGSGISSSPLVATLNRLYVGSKNGKIYAFARSTGDTV